VTVPVGVAAFPAEIIRPPRRWAERLYDLRHWTEMPRGGHFAAFEEPELLVEDIRKFFRALRIRPPSRSNT
jgi:pimeloyl-ACP methyl ester carboxylesterase